MATRYHPNFVKAPTNENGLPVGTDLVIKVDDNPRYIIGQLFKLKSFYKTLIQIEQTGSAQNPEKDQITLEMKEYSGGVAQNLPPGKYMVVTYAYIKGLGGKRWRDKFVVF